MYSSSSLSSGFPCISSKISSSDSSSGFFVADKSKFLRGDFEKAKEEMPSSEKTTVQEKEEENREVKQEEEAETNGAAGDISSKLEKLTKLYEEGTLTKEELKRKSDELISQI